MNGWGAIVVAGGRCDEALAKRIGTSRKALARFGGRTSLEWTLDAVREAGLEACATVGGDDLQPHLCHGFRLAEVGSAVDNAVAASQAMNCDKLVILPADLPLLRGEMIQSFLAEVDARIERTIWYSAGLCAERAYLEAFPGAVTTPLRLKDGPYLSGGFFATTPDGLIHGRELFQAIRRSRKSQAQMALKFGLGSALKFFMRQFSLAEAERRLERVLEGQAILCRNAHPASALDFDAPADVDHLERLFQTA